MCFRIHAYECFEKCPFMICPWWFYLEIIFGKKNRLAWNWSGNKIIPLNNEWWEFLQNNFYDLNTCINMVPLDDLKSLLENSLINKEKIQYILEHPFVLNTYYLSTMAHHQCMSYCVYSLHSLVRMASEWKTHLWLVAFLPPDSTMPFELFREHIYAACQLANSQNLCSVLFFVLSTLSVAVWTYK